MSNERNSYNLFSSVEKSNIEWLWYPYIPCAKITVLQGDPGGGKSSVMMDLIGRLTTGRKLMDGRSLNPINVLYQCSEDGLADTIKPRLEKAKADCNRVGYITEDIFGLTLDDEKIRTAIVDMTARLLVIDPYQAYIGDTDLSSARGIRRIMRRLSMWATAYNCATAYGLKCARFFAQSMVAGGIPVISGGAAEVRNAIDYGAAETVIVADTETRGSRTARMIEDAEQLGAGVVVLSTEFEPGKRLLGLGGVAALLRYKITG